MCVLPEPTHAVQPRELWNQPGKLHLNQGTTLPKPLTFVLVHLPSHSGTRNMAKKEIKLLGAFNASHVLQ